MHNGCALFEHGVQVCYTTASECGAKVIAGAINGAHQGDDNSPHVIIFATGHHTGCTHQDWDNLKNMNLSVPKGTRIIFQDFQLQHFAGSTTGEYMGSTNLSCQASLDAVPEVRKVELESAIPTITALGWTHLETYHIDEHAGRFHAEGPGNGKDCTHWMMPGVPDGWAKLLYQII
eukprot:CAMPEP_0168370622 /NCGR_PEP_ID=MMETSP0228-20121227/7357_1 /TAXON_ID=133427 /ORGANISM="Protoceratium reticulatum, Strain CCCM 535 (=CCMP 1889)" /LENGTH=175 /DNA_ID=CAMNT_0008383497 /DNA_START=593 /DNA_END=1120 /DNA_ORIENTATION=-